MSKRSATSPKQQVTIVERGNPSTAASTDESGLPGSAAYGSKAVMC
jgi:hypothetical protein